MTTSALHSGHIESCGGCFLTSSPVCMYTRADGFRKVMHIDTGIVKQERDGPVEFQHPFFKQGQDDLLENIKRKVHHLSVILSCYFSPKLVYISK